MILVKIVPIDLENYLWPTLPAQSRQGCSKDVSHKSKQSSRQEMAPGANVEEMKIGYRCNSW